MINTLVKVNAFIWINILCFTCDRITEASGNRQPNIIMIIADDLIFRNVALVHSRISHVLERLQEHGFLHQQHGLFLSEQDPARQFEIYREIYVRMWSPTRYMSGEHSSGIAVSGFTLVHTCVCTKGWMDVGFHGSDELQTPNIDALAYHGVSLFRHYSLPTCTPSRTALLTGRYPIRTGIHRPFAAGYPDGIPVNEILLPQYLRQLGYKTHLVGKWHVGYACEKHLPTNRGFNSHFGYYTGYIGYYDGIHIPSGKNLAGLDVRRNEKPAWTELSGHYATHVFTNEAIKVIEAHDEKSPLFLEVAHLAPHSGNTNARLQVSDIDENDKTFGYINDPNRRLYAGMVKELDNSVGSIITALDKKGILQNSIVIFMSDNGAPTYEPLWHTTNYGSNWPLRGEKGSLHEGGVRTVAALWSSHLQKPSLVHKHLFHIVDWLPTLFAAAGGTSDMLKNIDGINQWEEIINNSHNETVRYNYIGKNRTVLLDINENEAIIRDNWKIIQNYQSSPLSFTNRYYGANGSGAGIPDYDLKAVLTSPTSKILQSILAKIEGKTNHMDSISIEDIFKKLRNENRIDCKSSEIKNIEDCFDDYCLFNLEDDPCEKNNLIKIEKSKFNELHEVLNFYRNSVLKTNVSTYDENADPKFWNNYWSPWTNCGDGKSSANSFVNTSSYNYFIILIVNLIVMVNTIYNQ